MLGSKKVTFMPSGLRYKLGVCFCLTSLLPILAGTYIVSQFIQYPFHIKPENLMTISIVAVFSLLLSVLGFSVTRQLVDPITEMTKRAHHIAEGKLEETEGKADKSSDELEDLSNSLHLISRNAKDLLEKVEKLSMRDKLTGLYNATYIRERLSEEIQRAVHYQRPCSFAYFSVDGFVEYASRYGVEGVDELVKSIARLLSRELAEFDRAGRVSAGEFVIIFPDKSKKKTIEIVEKIKSEIVKNCFLALQNDAGAQLSIAIGISENPLDGVLSSELYLKAANRAKQAQISGGSLIEAFA